ncbi:MAG: nucleotidyltransferase domain-containing protein [Anaerolineales bacterium]|nr:nucleotidyltransferase domain-containing protein [Anaerolineales bacterium]
MMNLRELGLPNPQHVVASRFLDLCRADPRIVAAFIGGSYASGQADEFSDLDLYCVTTDEAYGDFVANKAGFARQLGRLLFLEDFGEAHGYLFVHENGTEGEFWFGRQSDFQAICSGPYQVLFDRLGLLGGGELPTPVADHERQLAVLRRQIDWFWHELSHFIKAMGRRQLWFAYGQVEAMRRMCVILARLDVDFTDAGALEGEPYFKIEEALPVAVLQPLRSTCCEVEQQALLQAGKTLCAYYRAVAPALAKTHGLTYSVELEQRLWAQLLRLEP